jgi:hypothetical protein
MKPIRPRLEYYLAHWPLLPPSFWCRRSVWVAGALAASVVEILTHPALHTMPLDLIPVLLAAWCGRLAWSVGLALVVPWNTWLSWWWWNKPWPLTVVIASVLTEIVVTAAAAGLMTALQRHAVRLALERDPQLPPDPQP